ncbi:FkbM family methyltransferase [Anabaenopsis elenkinii]|uniref:FkbM family methyltransferase n=1 Tax=Anabaenopsis elenkinii CCIBt3563 TaxID=2779889 RepID=A0A7S6REJ3_9CYAN|nr:FkbM family methyltransferase [Anabaenopsis elenkinii]QOV23330.1 FkbM family methyltransferase [Anabaenopsis elenkinii CCIBt3563]
MLSNKILLPLLLRIFPTHYHLPIEYYFRKINGQLEAEMFELSKIIKHQQRVIDVGANNGLYSYHLARFSAVVESFEPQVECANVIKQYSRKFAPDKINVHNIALSNMNGVMNLNIPILRGKINTTLAKGCATYRNLDCEHETLTVPVKKLDDFNFNNVALIKIDVEGYESY